MKKSKFTGDLISDAVIRVLKQHKLLGGMIVSMSYPELDVLHEEIKLKVNSELKKDRSFLEEQAESMVFET